MKYYQLCMGAPVFRKHLRIALISLVGSLILFPGALRAQPANPAPLAPPGSAAPAGADKTRKVGPAGKLALPAPTTKQKRKQATALFMEANALARRKLYLDALKKYRAARALYPSYKIDLNIGGVLDVMGRRAAAARHFEKFLISSRDTPPKIIEAARGRLAGLRNGLSSVKVECLVKDAVISVGGKDVARTPMDLPHYLEPGKHAVKITKKGFILSQKTLELAPGQHTIQNVRLRSVAESRDYLDFQQQLELRQSKTRRAYIALGVGTGLALGAIALYSVAASLGSRAHDEYQTAVWPDDIEDAEADIEFATGIYIGGHVVMGLAAGAVGYGVYELLSRPGAERPQESSGFTPLVGIGASTGGAQLTLRGSF